MWAPVIHSFTRSLLASERGVLLCCPVPAGRGARLKPPYVCLHATDDVFFFSLRRVESHGTTGPPIRLSETGRITCLHVRRESQVRRDVKCSTKAASHSTVTRLVYASECICRILMAGGDPSSIRRGLKGCLHRPPSIQMVSISSSFAATRKQLTRWCATWEVKGKEWLYTMIESVDYKIYLSSNI